MSVEGARQEDRLHSYGTQAEAIEANCLRECIELLDVGKERAVSGGADPAHRPELSRAVEAVEHRGADMIIGAYVDRFFRNFAVQAEVIARRELLALAPEQRRAAERLQANMCGAVAEFYRGQSAETSRAGQAAAVARGAAPWDGTPVGSRRRNDGTLEPNPDDGPLVIEAFRMRLAGAPVMTVRAMLREHGMTRWPRGVQQLPQSRVYVGEVRSATWRI